MLQFSFGSYRHVTGQAAETERNKFAESKRAFAEGKAIENQTDGTLDILMACIAVSLVANTVFVGRISRRCCCCSQRRVLLAVLDWRENRHRRQPAANQAAGQGRWRG